MKNGIYLWLMIALLFTACSDKYPTSTEHSKILFTLVNSQDYELHRLGHHLGESLGVIDVLVVPESKQIEVVYDQGMTNQQELALVAEGMPNQTEMQLTQVELPIDRALDLKETKGKKLINRDVIFENISFPSIFDALIIAYRKSGGYSHQ